MSHYSVDFITRCVWYIIFAFLPTHMRVGMREKGCNCSSYSDLYHVHYSPPLVSNTVGHQIKRHQNVSAHLS